MTLFKVAATPGDAPERMGDLRLQFRNAKGAKLVDDLGNDILDSNGNPITIPDNNEQYKFYIVDGSGNPTTGYQYEGIENINGIIGLTETQYKGMKIVPLEDDASPDIRIYIRTESHEVHDNGTLYATDIVSGTQTPANYRKGSCGNRSC